MSSVVAVVGSRVEAEMIVGMLQSHGIHATVSGDDIGGIDPALQAQGVRVITPEDDADAARQLIGAAASGTPARDRELNALQRWIVRVLGGSTPHS